MSVPVHPIEPAAAYIFWLGENTVVKQGGGGVDEKGGGLVGKYDVLTFDD